MNELRRGGGASSNTRDGQTALAARKAVDAERAEEAMRAKAAKEEAKRRAKRKEAADAKKVAKQENKERKKAPSAFKLQHEHDERVREEERAEKQRAKDLVAAQKRQQDALRAERRAAALRAAGARHSLILDMRCRPDSNSLYTHAPCLLSQLSCGAVVAAAARAGRSHLRPAHPAGAEQGRGHVAFLPQPPVGRHYPLLATPQARRLSNATANGLTSTSKLLVHLDTALPCLPRAIVVTWLGDFDWRVRLAGLKAFSLHGGDSTGNSAHVSAQHCAAIAALQEDLEPAVSAFARSLVTRIAPMWLTGPALHAPKTVLRLSRQLV